MARGNKIVVNPDARGHYEWGYLDGAYLPGTVVQIDPSVALKHGKHTWTVYNRDADGDQPKGPFAVIDYEPYLGRLASTAYASGDFAKLYLPSEGDELNMVVLNITGTADDHALGEILMVDDGTGKLIATTGTPETEVAVLLEAITDPTADTLAWVRWTGH